MLDIVADLLTWLTSLLESNLKIVSRVYLINFNSKSNPHNYIRQTHI